MCKKCDKVIDIILRKLYNYDDLVKSNRGSLVEMKSLQRKLMIAFSILLTLGMVSAQLITYLQVSNQVKDEVQSRGYSMATELKSDIQETIKEYSLDLVRYSKDSRIIKLGLNEDLEVVEEIKADFQIYLSNKESAEATYFATPNKKFYIKPDLEIPSDFDPTSRPWYTKALESTDKVIWTDPYLDISTNKFIITGAKAVLDSSNKVAGVIATDFTFSGIEELIKNKDVGYKGYPFLIDKNGLAIVHKDHSGKSIKENSFYNKVLTSSKGTATGENNGANSVLFYDTVGETNWKIGVVYIEDNLYNILDEIMIASIITAIVAQIVTLIINYFYSLSIAKPIRELASEVEKVAQGDLTVHVNPKTKDEVGQLTTSFNNMVSQMNSLIVEVDKSVLDVKTSSENLSAISEESIATSEEVASAMGDVAKGSAQQANDVEKVMLSTEDLGSMIESVNGSIIEMNKLSEESTKASNEGKNKVVQLRTRTSETMSEINSVESTIAELVDRVKEIESIIGTINDISAQTNLLALNASIEAARAGDSGRGFAVVAEEVRKLAEQSASATEEVRRTINGIQEETKHAVSAMNKTKQISLQTEEAVNTTENAFMVVTEVSTKLVDLINKVYKETKSVHEAKDIVLEGVKNISHVTHQSAASAEEVSASTDEQLTVLGNIAKSAEVLNESSNKLSDVIKVFKVK
jgi:methyl-accepting chemotaxis protein